ncbi:GCN5-related N-acetyltransferase [Brucella intermedia LMG 3301]|uniref:GCN5-related N-acetyltransferase n=1 Tax=Brucella intermedia LMG 3301 TaxID=641118 RepID=C4WP42_9HYPH|nr:GCN5-related N-acetyltransferase [Brucella intermedia LMG 3301]
MPRLFRSRARRWSMCWRAKPCWTARWVKAAAASHRKNCVVVACPQRGWPLPHLAKTERSQGTVRLWDVHAGLDAFGFPVSALLLGPLAVEPSAAGCGIGSALMRHAIDEAMRLGHGAILLVGDPEYYGRFGFTAEKTGELAMPGPYEKRRFLALELKPGHLDGAHGVLRASGRKVPRAEVLARRSA